MISKTVMLAAAVGSLFVLAGPAFSADDSNSEKCYGVTTPIWDYVFGTMRREARRS